MSEITPEVNSQVPADRRRGNLWLLHALDRLTFTSAAGGAVVMFALLIVLTVAIFLGALPSIRTFGFSFLTTSVWNPVTEKFGALPVVIGTLLTSLLAMAIAVPISIGSAVFLVKLAPRIRIPVPRMNRRGRKRFALYSPRHIVTFASFLIELLAAIPSIAYGMWGAAVLVPAMQSTVQPWADATLAKLPVVGSWFSNQTSGHGSGMNIFTASVVLAIMVTPIMTAIIRDVLLAAPPELEQGALGLGATWWQATRLVLGHSKLGIAGAVILGFARAIGETMAVTMVVGGSLDLPHSLFAPGQTISSLLANQFAEADTDAFVHALIYAAFVLLVITTLINGIARLMVMRTVRRAR